MPTVRTLSRSARLAAALLAASASCVAARAETYFLATGRWDNTIVVVDLARAMDRANDGTPNAIVNRVRVTPDLPGGAIASGQPVNVVVSADRRRAYVVNHSGPATEAAARAFQHGHPGLVTVVDLTRALNPAHRGTLGAVEGFIETGGAGPVGLALAPDGRHAFVTHAEEAGNEDGGNVVAVLDLAARRAVGRVVQAYGNPGFPCPPATVPHAAPHRDFGCFPDSNGIAYSPVGGGTVITGNGGTDDVSIIDATRALAGEGGAELARIPVQTGPFAVTVSPDGRFAAVANRESAREDAEGNTVSILDVEKARTDPRAAELARVRVCTDDPATRTRPFVAAFTPDGGRLVVTCFRSNNVAVLDLRRALAGGPAELRRIALETPGGAPSRPRGVAMTPDGRYAAITGAPRGEPGSSVLWILDLETYAVAGRVTGIGNESYMVATWVPPER